ncbi:CDP-glycerol glycerophosphotransferase family protein [Psychrobacillus sp. NPDC096623]|uniref:CDP-glycerol glycerophosphotransferase family protein n=1 Tax=Psychrobacillus sp. NPDC096623 TaxID=3364492 RepID=UPI0037FB227A
MKKIIIFGTGSGANNIIQELDEEKIEIIAFSDNDIRKQGLTFHNKKIIKPEEIVNKDYDLILIASQHVVEIFCRLKEMGIKEECIIPVYLKEALSTFKEENLQYKLNGLYKENRGYHEKIKIALVNKGYSGYNGYPLYKKVPKDILNKYNVDIIESNEIKKLKDYDVICSSNLEGIYTNRKINIELWHGFPIKQVGFRHKSSDNLILKSLSQNYKKYTQLICSYSEFYTTVLNSCYPAEIDRYRITGMPRNDFLFSGGGIEKLENLTYSNLKGKKCLFYMPTWRNGGKSELDSSKFTGLFGFIDEDLDVLKKYLKRNNFVLIVKLHPYEQKKFMDSEVFDNETIILLSDTQLEKRKIHLYELLSCAKLIITDYSSVYFDTLLIDLPIIFTMSDYNEYSEKRGFLIDTHEIITPGAKVYNMEGFIKEINTLFFTKDNFSEDRKKLCDIVHKYKDNQSSVRVWNEIDQVITKNIDIIRLKN